MRPVYGWPGESDVSNTGKLDVFPARGLPVPALPACELRSVPKKSGFDLRTESGIKCLYY